MQPPESFLCERDDGVNGWKIQVEQERLGSCRVTEVWTQELFVFFPAVSCSNEHFRTFKLENKVINDNRSMKVTDESANYIVFAIYWLYIKH